MKKKKNRIGHMIKWLLLLILLYIVGGALVPFLIHPKVDDEVKKELDVSRFYGDGTPCVDRAAVVETSQEALDTRLHMISEAKERIILTTFDIRMGKSTDDIFAQLLEAADRGVQVQILVDGLYGGVHMKDYPMFYAAGSHPNMEIRFYNTPSLKKPWTINGRLHDKYVIIDDKLLLVGGRNTFDYFLGNYNEKNLSYDRDVLIYNTASGTEHTGESSIARVEEYFQKVWNLDVCRTVYEKIPGEIKSEAQAERQRLQEHSAEMLAARPGLFEAGTDYEGVTVPTDKVTFIHNPTHILSKQPYVWYQLHQLMAGAKERVYIQTPYVAFSKSMYRDMAQIGSRGIRFEMQINNPAVGDNLMAGSDYLFQKKRVLQTGVQVYEFQGDHSSHGKSMLIDDRISLVGSYNLDMRSTYIDTETMLVIDGEEFQDRLEEKMMAMHAQSLAVNEDAEYEENPSVEAVPATGQKKRLFYVTPYLFQLIRFLI